MPTSMPYEIIVATKYDYGYTSYSLSPIAFNDPSRRIFERFICQGDVVIFKTKKIGWNIIKRVIGMPGQKIQFVDGMLFIDGEPVQKNFDKIITLENKNFAQYTEIPKMEYSTIF